MLAHPVIAVCDPFYSSDIEALASRLMLPRVEGSIEAIPATASHVLWVTREGLALGPRGLAPQRATRVDFLDDTLQYRLHTSGKRQGLGKAVGLDKAAGLRIMDATAGLGRDALVLAHLGCLVTLVERDPLLHALLDDGMQRALANGDDRLRSTLGRMQLVKGDCRESFAAVARGDLPRPDVVYLDPMFPPRSKSARVKKDIALLQDLLGAEHHVGVLLEQARQCARHRVVLKRPGHGVEEELPEPDFVVGGKTAQFAVYVNSSFSSMRR